MATRGHSLSSSITEMVIFSSLAPKIIRQLFGLLIMANDWAHIVVTMEPFGAAMFQVTSFSLYLLRIQNNVIFSVVLIGVRFCYLELVFDEIMQGIRDY